jgi:SnoaL-like domain
MAWHDIDLRNYRDVVVTIATQSQEAAHKGMPSNGDFRITHVFVRADDRWAIAGMHLSPTSFSPPVPAPTQDTTR